MHAYPSRRPGIPASLSDELVEDLALLHGAPAGIAESTIALMRFGSRLALEANRLIELRGDRPARITITDRGWRVIEACAQEALAGGSAQRR